MLRRAGSRLHLIMAVPALLLFGFFFILPLARGVWLSLTDWNGVSKANFVGLQNFAEFFHDPRALHDVLITVLFALGSAPLLNLFGLAYALVLDHEFHGRNLVRTMVYLPAIISPLIMGYIWYFILQPQRGVLWQIASSINPSFAGGNWLASPRGALVVLILVNVWQYSGMTMVVYLAGLQSIPSEVLEASAIDGASYFQTLCHVVLPILVSSSVKINVITNIIGSLSVFDVIMALTEGGPGYGTESLSIYIMRMCYGSFTGYSTAVALVLFLIVLIPVLVSLRFFRSVEFEA